MDRLSDLTLALAPGRSPAIQQGEEGRRAIRHDPHHRRQRSWATSSNRPHSSPNRRIGCSFRSISPASRPSTARARTAPCHIRRGAAMARRPADRPDAAPAGGRESERGPSRISRRSSRFVTGSWRHGVDRSTLTELSMGMSDDFEVAVEEGATLRPRRSRDLRESDRVIRDTATGVEISVRVIPRARRSEVSGRRGDALLVRLAAPPLEGAANTRACRIARRPTRHLRPFHPDHRRRTLARQARGRFRTDPRTFLRSLGLPE